MKIEAKFAGTDGTELWHRTLDGTAGDDDCCRSLSVGGFGDVVAAGVLVNTETGADFFVVKLSGTTGTELWRRVIDAPGNGRDEAFSVRIDKSGNVIASGTLAAGDADEGFNVVRLSGATGAWLNGRCSLPRFGHRLVVTDNAVDATKRRVALVLRDAGIEAPPAGSENDPTVAGATFFLGNPSTRESVALSPPATGWTAVGKPAGSKGYRYRSEKGAGFPCKSARLVPGKIFKVKCSAKYGPIAFTLDEARQLT